MIGELVTAAGADDVVLCDVTVGWSCDSGPAVGELA